jgi:uncharacterized protein with PIN domain
VAGADPEEGAQGAGVISCSFSRLSCRRKQGITEAVTDADIAREALARYGKGRHPAGPNFGDAWARHSKPRLRFG